MHARTVRASLAVYGLLHFLIDAIGAATVFAILERDGRSPGTPLLLAYGLISFASRPLLGLLVDARDSARHAAMAGSALVACGSVLFAGRPFEAVVALGIGNALFHVGAGSISFRLMPGRAGPSGLFAAPGALGVFAGTTLGSHALTHSWIGGSALLVLAAVSSTLSEPPRDVDSSNVDARDTDAPVLFVLLSIALVSFAGFALRFPWQSTPSLAIVVVTGVAIGRAAGGVLADTFGWRLIALGGLLAAIPLLMSGATHVILGVFGAVLLNLAIPVASTVTFNRLRAHPAFAFGLVSLALIAGGLPALVGASASTLPRNSGLLALPLACGALYFGFRRASLLTTAALRRVQIASPT
ncbi:MAG: hypothetical protein IPP90_03135 [Gemmatimonadaceae bacterium]|nr:hypothetical protein [Gemmatimonadaceae bacterium]